MRQLFFLKVNFMKPSLVLLFATGSLGFYLCNRPEKNVAQPMVYNSSSNPLIDSVDFETQLLPILQNKCNPCHFPGGKMYGKMPFDSSKTIIEHGEGIMRRFKDENEKALLRRYLDQNKQAVN